MTVHILHIFRKTRCRFGLRMRSLRDTSDHWRPNSMVRAKTPAATKLASNEREHDACKTQEYRDYEYFDGKRNAEMWSFSDVDTWTSPILSGYVLIQQCAPMAVSRMSLERPNEPTGHRPTFAVQMGDPDPRRVSTGCLIRCRQSIANVPEGK